jgi:thiamine-phosphate diphosphorylase
VKKDLGIYLVTDTVQCGSRGVVETVRQAVAGGVHTVQVRDKTADAADLLTLLIAVANAVGKDATVLVNDRVDVYLAARARATSVHGVHIGQNDLPPADTRKLIGPDAIVGLTANTQAHFDIANTLPSGTVDYLGVGVIRATATKPDHPEALGIDGFARLAQTTTIPCVAIGGITTADIGGLRTHGAAGAAVVSAICAPTDPSASAHTLTRKWKEARI